jgi:hypothetical protein
VILATAWSIAFVFETKGLIQLDCIYSACTSVYVRSWRAKYYNVYFYVTGLERWQKYHEFDIGMLTSLADVFCGFPLFHPTNAAWSTIYKPQPITIIHPIVSIRLYLVLVPVNLKGATSRVVICSV